MNLVKQSLFICIGVLLALIGAQGVQSLWQVSRLSGATDHIVASGQVASDARNLWTLFLATEQRFKEATAFVDAASAEGQRQAFGESAAALRGALATMKTSSVGELNADVVALSTQVERWLGLAARHVSAEGATELPAYHLLAEERDTLEGKIGALTTHSAELAMASVAASHASARSAYLWTIVDLVVAVALGVGLGWFALKSLHRQLGADASDVARIATSVANGDLTVPIQTAGVPEGSVMAATSRMQDALVKTVTRVRGISGNLATGANEIAMGNSDLSVRTEQQAVALERTKSAMENLGNAVRHNADNANRASQLAGDASGVAQRGGTEVNQAVETMQHINASSKRIADIIGVIDGIAFQTNILALNAAVEAARAGEQGRGFAVVAGEVRSLAQRSAEAAKEIKGLINESVSRVEQGTALVDRAGATMHDVVKAIQGVSLVMDEIRHASAEQSSGVAQVGEAVTQMDQATQQNAALAEESASAAESLKTQALQLVEAVSFFKVAMTEVAANAPAPAASRPLSGGQAGTDRRGPNRATNVTRPSFGKASPATQAAPTAGHGRHPGTRAA